MDILLHTLQREPLRPAEPLRPLVELLPAMASAGFYKLDVAERHIAGARDEGELAAAFAECHLLPTVLSSNLLLTSERQSEAEALLARIDRFGFRKVALRAESADALRALRALASRRPEVLFLVETVADHHPTAPSRLIEACGLPNVGLMWQANGCDRDALNVQFDLQQPFIRHLRMNNRDAAGEPARLADGVIPWEEIFPSLHFGADVSLDLPGGGGDLTRALQEAVEEVDYIVGLEKKLSGAAG